MKQNSITFSLCQCSQLERATFGSHTLRQGTFRREKLHYQTAAAHFCSFGQELCIPIGSVFSLASSYVIDKDSHNLVEKSKVFAIFPDLDKSIQKYSELINLVKLPKNEEKCLRLLAYATADKINKGAFGGRKQVPNQHAMLTGYSMVTDVQARLKPALTCSVESIFVLLGDPGKQVRKILLYVDKHYKALCSCVCKQLGVLISTRNLKISVLEGKRKDLIKIMLTVWNSRWC